MEVLKKYLRAGGYIIVAMWILLEVMNPGWTINVLLGVDILANTLMGGQVETISARAGKALDDSYLAQGLCFVLDIVDPNHCIDAAN